MYGKYQSNAAGYERRMPKIRLTKLYLRRKEQVPMEVKHISSKEELDKAFYIRREVFIKEQNVSPEAEFDGRDESAEHVLVYYDNQPAATGRLRIVNNIAKLERICVLPEYRKCGLGKAIVQALEDIAKKKGLTKAKLHGQTQAKVFYEKLGYTVASDEFMEDGIPHYLMLKDLN